MKLAIITALPPSKVTLSEYGYHLVKHLRQHTELEELILITDKTDEPKSLTFEEEGCRVTIKECWEFNGYLNLFKIGKALSETKPDGVLLNLQFLKFGDKKIPAALGLMLPLLCRAKRIPVITLLHNITEQVALDNAGITQNRILQRIYGFIGTQLTRCILASDVLAVTISKYVDILESKYRARNIALIPHGSFETPPEPQYELPSGPCQVMAFGKFGTYKKVEILIEAVALIRSRTKLNIEIVIAGTDSPNTPGYLDDVRKRYQNIEQLRFTGYVPEEDVALVFGQAAVVVFPYTSTTGSSGVLHQAGSYGKAAVLPDLGDLGILVREEGYSGEFFEPENIDSLADAIQKIVEQDSHRVELGKSNYRAACSLPMSVIAQTYVDFFKALRLRNEAGFQLQLPKRVQAKLDS
ncbi:MAG: glycosyltransferase [Flavobacteriaceae bacterium]